LRIAELVNHDFTLDNLVYSPSEFLELVIDRKDGDVIVFDEAGVNIFSREWQSKMNRALAKVFQILGYKHLGIILTFPSVMFIDKAIRRLFNYILLAEGFDREKEISFCKAYYNLPKNYVLGTEILVPFSYIDKDAKKVDASDLVFSRPKLADQYEEYARHRKDQLLRELKQDILTLAGGQRKDVDDSVAYFINECLMKGSGVRIPKKELYELYLQFCQKHAFDPVGKIEFGRQLKARLNVGETKIKSTRYWVGIAVK
jgi:hypothetical protein